MKDLQEVNRHGILLTQKSHPDRMTRRENGRFRKWLLISGTGGSFHRNTHDVRESLDGLSGLVDGVPVILSKSGAPVDRSRFTVLHELGHVILRFGVGLEPKTKEKYCHAFAGAMLLPIKALKRELGKERRSAVSVPELVHLKEHYGISIQAAMARVHMLGIVSDAAYREFNIFVNAHKLRQNEPGEYPIDERPSRFKKLLHRALAEEVVSLSKAAVLARVPIEKLQQEMVSGG